MYQAVEASRCKHRYVFILFNLIFCLFLNLKKTLKFYFVLFREVIFLFFQFLSRWNVNWFNGSKKRRVLGSVDVKENLIYIFTERKISKAFISVRTGVNTQKINQLKQIIQQTNQNLAHASWSARWNDCDQGIALNSDWVRK